MPPTGAWVIVPAAVNTVCGPVTFPPPPNGGTWVPASLGQLPYLDHTTSPPETRMRGYVLLREVTRDDDPYDEALDARRPGSAR
ncbi:MAG: hypothetical protein KDD82_14075 [Planctomycetes bacterium]|nr:hypothetical protein [Planctomycetota bacterium]